LKIPNIICKIEVYCPINSSENPDKVKQAVSKVLPDMNLIIKKDSLKATSANIDSLKRIFDAIHTRKTQKTYKRHLTKNLVDDSTWFYLNKQAAFADIVSLCDEADESPLGPIKIILSSKNIEKVIEWLISDS